MYKTSLFMNIFNIKKIGSKKLISKLMSKIHVTATLWIVADSTVTPMLVFICQLEGRVERRLHKILLSKG